MSAQGIPSDTIFAVVGATGKQGGATARALLEAGVKVRALTRNAESDAARELAAIGAEIAVADLADPAGARGALTGAQRVFSMATTATGGLEGEIIVGRSVARAAKDTGVAHLVYSSVGGVERHTSIPHFESKRRIEEEITDLGVSTTFLRPVFFMENLLRAARVEGDEVVVRQPVPDGIALQLVAVADIGAAAAALLLEPGRAGDSIELAGDSLTGSQIAERFGAYAGLPARYEALPLSVLEGNADLHAMYAWFATGGPDGLAYQADFAGSHDLVKNLHTLDSWLPTSTWSTGS